MLIKKTKNKELAHRHEFYEKKDFTEAEIDRENLLAVEVLVNKQKICKLCGFHRKIRTKK